MVCDITFFSRYQYNPSSVHSKIFFFQRLISWISYIAPLMYVFKQLYQSRLNGCRQAKTCSLENGQYFTKSTVLQTEECHSVIVACIFASCDCDRALLSIRACSLLHKGIHLHSFTARQTELRWMPRVVSKCKPCTVCSHWHMLEG